MKSLPKILLLIDKGTAYGRGLLKGIAEYSLINGPWLFYWDEPFYHASKKSLMRIIKEWQPDGIIVRDTGHFDEVVSSSVPIVYAEPSVNSPKPDLPCAIYTCDWKATAQMAAEHLIGQGFKKFAYCGYNDLNWSCIRGSFFEEFLTDKGYSSYIYGGQSNNLEPWNEELAEVTDWLKKLPKPIGLMACNDDRAQQIVEACKLGKILVPDEVAIIGVDNDELICTLSVPQLSSVNLNPEKVGYEIGELMKDLLEKGTTDKVAVDRPTHVHIRQSTDILAIDDPEVVKAMRFIRLNSRNMIQVRDVVEQTKLSKRTLELKFKKVIGLSILEEIKRNKINEICKLLLTTNWSVTRIAMHMGFNGSDHFARYFSQIKGISPAKYRKNI